MSDLASQVKAVVWDLSGVLTEERDILVEHFAERCTLPVEDWMRIFDAYCVREHAWDRVERDELSLTVFAEQLAALVARAGGRCDVALAKTLWGDPDPFTDAVRVRAELFPLIEGLRRSHVSALCTNNVAEWRPIWQDMIPVARLFDYVIDSSGIGARKPDRAFFEHVESVVGYSGSEILFIDDRAQNVIAARCHHDWRIVLFENSTSLCASLSGYGFPADGLPETDHG